jgi:hypothetical protein
MPLAFRHVPLSLRKMLFYHGAVHGAEHTLAP